MFHSRFSHVVIAFFFLTLFTNSGHAIILVEDGSAQAVIVVDKEAIASEQYAAEELAHFLEEISGAKFSIENHADSLKSRILIGPDAARKADSSFNDEGLRSDGIVIRTAGSDLILAGDRPRGTLYAVYTLLEEHLGCRWWAPGASTIPQKKTIRFDDLNIRYVPQMEYREPYWHDAMDRTWAARNKGNGHWMETDERHGGQVKLSGWCHTFERLIPPEKYFRQHPEWFSEFDGKRQAHRSQLCLTNAEMRRELVKNAKQMLRDEPSHLIAISQNDWHGHCKCAKCSAVNEKEGSLSGTLVRFINDVADEMQDDFPGVSVVTLAYQRTRHAPKYVKPNEHVIIQLCSIECSFSRPLNHPRNRAFLEDINEWSQISDRLYIWDYTTNFHHYLAPQPNIRSMIENHRLFASRNVTGVFSQGAFYGPSCEFAELRAWVAAKQLWNPALDGEKLVEEFIDGYWGPAAPAVREYINLIHDEVEKTDDWLGCYAKPWDCSFMNFQTMTQALEILKKGELMVADQPELLQRVRTVELGPLYAFLAKWDSFRNTAEKSGRPWPVPPTQAGLWSVFVKMGRDAGVTSVYEGDRTGMSTLIRRLNLNF